MPHTGTFGPWSKDHTRSTLQAAAGAEAALDSGTALAGLITILASRPWLLADRELREYAALAAAVLAGLLLMTVTLTVS